jgi:ABC-type nitrate/sulfonate/bicarbonate transport system substrate-binding protein
MFGLRKTLLAAPALAAALAAAAPPPAHAAVEETSLAIPALALIFAPIYIADAQGFWTKHELNVKLHDIVGIGSMNAVLAKSVDFSTSSGPTVIRAFVRGQKVIAIGETLQVLPFEVVLRKDLADQMHITPQSPAKARAESLKGKKVSMISPNTIVHAYLRYFLRQNGVDPERDITLAYMPPEAGLAALKSKAIDAYNQGLPWTEIAVQQGLAVRVSSVSIGDLKELFPISSNVIDTRADFCNEKPSVCTKMMQGITDAMTFILDHPKESIDILAKKFPTLEHNVFVNSFEVIRKGTPRSSKVTETSMANAQKLMLSGGMLKPDEKLASFKDIYTDKYAH